jgi:hypothetical protein
MHGPLNVKIEQTITMYIRIGFVRLDNLSTISNPRTLPSLVKTGPFNAELLPY